MRQVVTSGWLDKNPKWSDSGVTPDYGSCLGMGNQGTCVEYSLAHIEGGEDGVITRFSLAVGNSSGQYIQKKKSG